MKGHRFTALLQFIAAAANLVAALAWASQGTPLLAVCFGIAACFSAASGVLYLRLSDTRP